MKPTAIDRYILAELVPVFGVSLAVFTLVFLSHQILDITNFIVNYGTGLGVVMLMLAYSTPYFLVYVIPISTMMAVLLTFLRMSGDNEIVALKSSGVSLYRLCYPMMGFCVAACLLTLLVTVWGLPRGKVAFKQLAYTVVTSNPNLGIVDREFNTLLNGITLYVGQFDKKQRALSDVFIEDQRSAGKPVTICAPSGTLDVDMAGRVVRLSLTDGRMYQVDLQDRSSRVIRFDTYDIHLDLERAGQMVSAAVRSEKEMSLAELVDHIQKARAAGLPQESARMELHKKFSIPFACVVLGLLAVPLGVQARGRKTSSGIGLALVFFLLYYLVLSGGEILGESGFLHPALAMWLPDMVMGGLGLFLYAEAARDRNLRELFEMLQGRFRAGARGETA